MGKSRSPGYYSHFKVIWAAGNLFSVLERLLSTPEPPYNKFTDSQVKQSKDGGPVEK